MKRAIVIIVGVGVATFVCCTLTAVALVNLVATNGGGCGCR
jgi:hypothetical protein